LKNGSKKADIIVMKYLLKLMLSVVLFTQSICLPVMAAGTTLQNDPYVVRGDDPNVKLGSIYYTSTKKTDVLLKGSIWGAVQFPGVHYLPLGTRLLDALSIAGGPLDAADEDNVILSTKTDKGLQVKTISVNQALQDEAYNPFIQANDIILIKEDHTYKNWSFALQAGSFIISVFVLGMLIEDRNKK
jgi:SLBB domain